MANNKEDALYRQIAFLMKQCYPTVVYRFDFGAGAYLSKNYRLMNLQKDIQLQNWKHPDFTMYLPVIMDGIIYHGQCLELKAEGERIYKRDGDYVSPHVKQQAEALNKLRELGYNAEFCIGIYQFQTLVDNYISWTGIPKLRDIKF